MFPTAEGETLAREGRGAVVSVRITEGEQQRLRRVAEDRQTSVSELVRRAALREVVGQPKVVTTTSATETQTAQVGRGMFWDAPAGAKVSGNTITI